MKGVKLSPEMMMAGAALLAVAYFWMRGAKNAGKDIGEAVSGAVVGTVDGVLSGTVTGVGEMVGVPKTSKTACQKSIEEFRAAPWYEQALLSFQVSADCTAKEYLRFATTGKGPGE